MATYLPSILEYLEKEDALMKERRTNLDIIVDLLHKVDDYAMYPNIYKRSDEEIKELEVKIEKLRARDGEIDNELIVVRENIRRRIHRLFDV